MLVTDIEIKITLLRSSQVRNLMHPNLQRFIGVAVNEDNLCEVVVGEACRKGSLKDLLGNDRMDLDTSFKYSLLKNLASVRTCSVDRQADLLARQTVRQ